MKIAGFNEEKCSQRERIAAKQGFDVVTLRYVGETADEANAGWHSLKNTGSIPKNVDAAIKLINSKLPEGATPLTAQDVFFQIYEAANSNFISDRSMFLHESTLRNIATGADNGVSFMNSHRTGGPSEPTELPFGQSFAGMYQEGYDDSGLLSRRSLICVYMVKGIHPNGANGPSTNDLHRMFETGSINNVSVGLSGGNRTCDVCGNAMGYGDDAYDQIPDGNGVTISVRKCKHAPGTKQNMSDDEISAQKKRSPQNSLGIATYSLCNATLQELSAVYKGAVPGAGIRQILSLSKDGDMTPEAVQQMLQDAYDYYGPLLPFDLGEIVSFKQVAKNAESNNKGKGDEMRLPTMEQLTTLSLAELVKIMGKEDAQAEPAVEFSADAEAKIKQLETELAAERARSAELASSDEKDLEAREAADLEAFRLSVLPKFTKATVGPVLASFKLAQAQDRLGVKEVRAKVDGKGNATGETELVSATQLLRETFANLPSHASLSRVASPKDSDANFAGGQEQSKEAEPDGAEPVFPPEGEEAALKAAARADALKHLGMTEEELAALKKNR